MPAYDYFPFLKRPAPRFVTESGAPVYGVLAEFHTPAEVYHAAEKVRDAGYAQWDVYSPFPIHGMEEAMGIKRTILPLVVGGAAITGVGFSLFMQWYITAFDYQMLVQGKNWNSWEPWVPVLFELGVLFSAFASLFGMLILNGLPRWHHPLMKKLRFLKSSDDKFILAIEAADPKFDQNRTWDMVKQLGAKHVEWVEE